MRRIIPEMEEVLMRKYHYEYRPPEIGKEFKPTMIAKHVLERFKT